MFKSSPLRFAVLSSTLAVPKFSDNSALEAIFVCLWSITGLLEKPRDVDVMSNAVEYFQYLELGTGGSCCPDSSALDRGQAILGCCHHYEFFRFVRNH